MRYRSRATNPPWRPPWAFCRRTYRTLFSPRAVTEVVQCVELNKGRVEARALEQFSVSAEAACFPFVAQAAHLTRFIDRKDKSRVRTRASAFNLGLFRSAANSFGIVWIKRQRDKRKATLPGFYDDMSLKNSRKALCTTFPS